MEPAIIGRTGELNHPWADIYRDAIAFCRFGADEIAAVSGVRGQLDFEATLFQSSSRSPVVGMRFTSDGDSGAGSSVGCGPVQCTPPSSE